MEKKQSEALEEILQIITAHIDDANVASIAFVIVRGDGIPIFGHANPTYDLIGSLELCKAGIVGRMFRDAQSIMDDGEGGLS